MDHVTAQHVQYASWKATGVFEREQNLIGPFRVGLATPALRIFAAAGAFPERSDGGAEVGQAGSVTRKAAQL